MKAVMISGVPGTGKTTLGYRLALHFGIDKVLSMDVVKNVVKGFTSPSAAPHLFRDSHEAYAHDGKAMIDGYLMHAAAVNALLIPTINQLKDSIVIAEGVTLHAEFANELAIQGHEVRHLNLWLPRENLTERYAQKSKLRPDAWTMNLDRIMEIQTYLLETSDSNIHSDGVSATLEKAVTVIEDLFN